MAHLVLVTGGSRSGKSAYAERVAESFPGPHCYVATCIPEDEEMRERVRKHQSRRDPERWRTVEEPLDLAAAIQREATGGVVLVECVPLWVSNLMTWAHDHAEPLGEPDIAQEMDALLGVCAAAAGVVIFVTGEVGMGIVPDNPIARRYRDLLGRANQMIAARADDVALVACGIPLHLKGSDLA